MLSNINDNIYNEEELKVLNWVKSLASSQGFYGRLYEELINNKELIENLASNQFNDILDLIFYLEC